MRLLISLGFVWVLLSATPIMAESKIETIGGMKSACEIAIKRDPQSDDEIALTALCVGWVITEDNYRTGFCNSLKGGAKLDDYSSSLARDTFEETRETLIEGFLNWANQNQEWWSYNLYWLIPNPDFWSEFPCKMDD